MAGSYYLSPFASFLQCLNDAGQVQPGLLIWTYQANTSTPVATYTDVTGTVPNSNPIQLNAAGRLQNVSIWQTQATSVKFQFSTNAGSVGSPVFGQQIGPTFDWVTGINDPTPLMSLLLLPTSGSGADLVANAMRSYDLIATVRAANVPSLLSGQTLIIDLEGGTTVNDGAGGFFYWNATSILADDGVNVIKPAAAGTTGRYERLIVPTGSSGSFTTTLTGCTTAPTVTVYYSRAGGPSNGVMNCSLVGTSGTSNSTSFGLSSWPIPLRPFTGTAGSAVLPGIDNGVPVPCTILVPNGLGGLLPSINILNASGNWTSSGQKGISSCNFSYVLR